jgi:stage V sporulation protein SpoVS
MLFLVCMLLQTTAHCNCSSAALCCPRQYFLKREAAEAIEGLKETPHKVAGALGTAVEIGSGVLQHIGEKVGDAAHMVAHPGARTAGNIARQQRAEVSRIGGRSVQDVVVGFWLEM